MSFQAVPRSAVAEDIVSQLLAMIREKKLRPGDKLPPERELATMLNVSRPSLREALRTLSVMHVVEMRQGSGCYITSLEPDALVKHLDFVFALDDSTYLQLLETRKIIEPGICALAAQSITEAELARLDACLELTRAGQADLEAYLQADIDLHDIIANAARNPLLRRFMVSARSLAKASRQRTALLPGIVEQTIRDHEAIIQALREHQPEAARVAMLAHLDHLEQSLQAQQE